MIGQRLMQQNCSMIYSEKNNDNNYYLDDGIYDSLVMAIARKTTIYYDVLIKKKSLILTLFTKLSFLYISFFK